MKHQLKKGQIVRCLDLLTKVVDFHEITGDPILRELWGDGSRWISNAEFCEPVDERPAEVWCHKDGLVFFG
jgi:hypothetical protein